MDDMEPAAKVFKRNCSACARVGLGWAGLAGLELAKCMNAKLFPISHRAETRDRIRTRHGRRSLCVRTRAAPPIAAEMATATPISIIIVWDKDLFWDLKKWANRMIMCRLYSVKTDIFKNAFFWNFFIRNDLSRVDLIIKMVLEFLSNL